MAISLAALGGTPLSMIWRKYESHVQKRPLLVNMATSATLWAAGDMLSQRVQRLPMQRAGARQTALTCAFGGLVFGPMGYAWYQWLDIASKSLGSPSSVPVILAKVLADNFIWSAAYVGMFMAYSSIVINRVGLKGAQEKISNEFLPTMCLYGIIWPPIMALMFMRVPLRHQLLVVNSLTVADACFLSWIENHSVDELAMAAMTAIGIEDTTASDEDSTNNTGVLPQLEGKIHGRVRQRP